MYEWEEQDQTSYIKTEEELRLILANIIEAKSTRQKSEAVDMLNHNIWAPDFGTHLVNIIVDQNTPQKIREVAADFMKNCRSDLGDIIGNNQENTLKLVQRILSESSPTFRAMLKQCFDLLIDQYSDMAYLEEVFEAKIESIPCKQGNLSLFDPLLALYEQMKTRYWARRVQRVLLEALSRAGIVYAKKISKMTLQQLAVNEKNIFLRVKKLFEFVRGQIDGFFDQDPQGMGDFLREFKPLTNLYQEYLLLFSTNGSIISHVPPCPYNSNEKMSLNSTKRCTSESCTAAFTLKYNMLQTITQNYKFGQPEDNYPQEIALITLETIKKCTKVLSGKSFATFMSYCLSICEKSLDYFNAIFASREQQVELFSALFIMLACTDEEIANIQIQPMKFMAETNYCFDFEQKVQTLRVKTAFFLKEYIKKFHSSFKLLEDIVSLLADVLKIQDSDIFLLTRQGVTTTISQYSLFPFYQMSTDKKVQALLLTLSIVVSTMQHEEEILLQLSRFLLPQFNKFVSIESPVTTLRVMRAYSYFISPQYLQFVQSQLNRGLVFMMQGLASFRKILQVSRAPEILLFISSNFQQIIQLVQINDPLLYRVVQGSYEQVLKGKQESINALISKIKRSFFQQKQRVEKQSSHKNASLNIFHLIVKNQASTDILSVLFQILHEFYFCIQSDFTLKYNYQEKIMLIYSDMMEKYEISQSPIQELVMKSLKYIGKQQCNDKLCRFYNLSFMKMGSLQADMTPYYGPFLQQIKEMIQSHRFTRKTPSKDMLLYYSFLVSQLIVYQPTLCLSDGGLLMFFYMIKYLPRVYQQGIIAILLTYAYMRPSEFAKFLKQNSICRVFLKKVLKVQMRQPFFKKIFNLAFIRLLEIQQDTVFGTKLMVQCLRNIKELSNISGKSKQKNSASTSSFTRVINKMSNSKLFIINEQKDNNEQNNQPVRNLGGRFSDFKHPLQEVNEIEAFKNVYTVRKREIESRLSSRQISDLRAIVQPPSATEVKITQKYQNSSSSRLQTIHEEHCQ